uniref:SOSS complex subunit A homolog n=1 Tax=Panagrellus redivivus TaxID=6233 RepID=A0A7E4UMM1_PANRE
MRLQTLQGKPHTRYQPAGEHEQKMEKNVLILEDVISKYTEADALAKVISMASSSNEGCDIVASGSVFGALTSQDKDTYMRFSKFIQQTWTTNAQLALTPMNYIVIELFWDLTDVVLDNFMRLLSDMLRWRILKVEVIVLNTFKAFIDIGPFPRRYNPLSQLLRIVRTNADFLLGNVKDGAFLVSMLSTICTIYLSEIKQCPPDRAGDAKRLLIQALENIYAAYFGPHQSVWGRNVIMTLTLLSRIPEISSLWKQLVTAPQNISPHCFGVADLLRRPPAQWIEPSMFPFSLTKKVEWFIHTPPEMCRRQLQFFSRELTSSSPDGILRFITIRFFLNPHNENPITSELRALHIASLIEYCKGPNSFNFVELQLAKIALIFDWLGFEAAPPNAPLPSPSVTSWRVFSHFVLTNPQIGNSIYEFLILFVQCLYPPLTPVFVRSVTRTFTTIDKTRLNYNLPPISSILDCTKVDKPLRELFKETFPDLAPFFAQRGPLNGLAPIPPVPTVSTISVAQVLDQPPPPVKKEPEPGPSNSTEKADGPAVVSPNTEKRRKKRRAAKAAAAAAAAAAATSVSASTVHESTSEIVDPGGAGWDASLDGTVEQHLGALPDEVKDDLLRLETAINEEKFDSTFEIVDSLFSSIFKNQDVIDDDDVPVNKEAIADCILVIFKKFLMAKEFLTVDEADENTDMRMVFTHPFYLILRQLYVHDECSLVFSFFELMYVKCPPIGYLLLFYVVASKIQAEVGLAQDDYIAAYREFAKGNDKDVGTELADDMESCAQDDPALYRYLIPLIFEHFPKYATGCEAVIKTLCTYCTPQLILDIASHNVRENFNLFKKETFTSIMTASLEWEDFEQVFFWHLVKAEGVPFDWISAGFPKIDYVKNNEAAFQAMIMIRTYAEPSMVLVRQLISRKAGDLFTLNAAKIIINDDSDCSKFAANVNTLMRKAFDADDYVEEAHTKKKSRSAAPKKTVPLHTILSHLDMLRQYCLAKPSGQTEKLFKEFTDVFAEMKTTPQAADTCREFAELFSAVELLSGSSAGRNLRKHRSRGGYDLDDSPKTVPNKRRRIKSSSSEED